MVPVLGQALGLESGGTEELRMAGCIGTTNGHEHTAGEVHTVFLPELLEGPLVLDDLPAVYPEYQVDDRWQSCARRDGKAQPRDIQLGLGCLDSRGSP